MHSLKAVQIEVNQCREKLSTRPFKHNTNAPKYF